MFKSLHGYFGKCGLDTVREFAIDVLPHMRRDILSRVNVVRWDEDTRLPVVKSTFGSLSGLNAWAGENYGYCFDILWNGE